jgi:hypothetical protein
VRHKSWSRAHRTPTTGVTAHRRCAAAVLPLPLRCHACIFLSPFYVAAHSPPPSVHIGLPRSQRRPPHRTSSPERPSTSVSSAPLVSMPEKSHRVLHTPVNLSMKTKSKAAHHRAATGHATPCAAHAFAMARVHFGPAVSHSYSG